MNSNGNSQHDAKQLGLVPLYPFPSITRKSTTATPTSSLPYASFLPPNNVSFIEEMAPIESNRILSELITEEILDIYEELFKEGGSFLEETLEKEFKQKAAIEESVSKSVAREILQDIIKEDCRNTVLDCLDDIVKSHASEIESRLSAEILLIDFEKEFLAEIAESVINNKIQKQECSSILEEVLKSDLHSLAEEVLIHCGANHAFSQYKEIAQYACDSIMDGMCLQLLLPRPETQRFDLSYILDDMIFGILLNKTLEVTESSKDDTCLPILWYRRNILQNILLEMTLNELTKANSVT